LAVNEIRQKRNMSPLEIILIDLIEDGAQGEFEEEKVSSSSQRMRLLGTELRKPLREWHCNQARFLRHLIYFEP
jgi:phosphopantetheine adenylyltransferase